MIDVVLQNEWVLCHISKDKDDEPLPLLTCNFSEISKEDRSSSSHLGIQNVPLNVCYGVAQYQVPSKNQGMCKVCKNNFRCRCVRCKANLHDICFETFQGY